MRANDYSNDALRHILNLLNEKDKQPVVLVDEYDVPVHGKKHILEILHRFSLEE